MGGPGNFQTFYTDLGCSGGNPYGLPYYPSGNYDVLGVGAIQAAITGALKDEILSFFFGDTNRPLVLTAMDDYGYTLSTDGSSLVSLVNIELASQK